MKLYNFAQHSNDMKCSKKKENLGSSDLLIFITNPLLNMYILTHHIVLSKAEKEEDRKTL